ncbi:DUF2695 domain-containing protein [Salana multivorans]
MNMTIDLETEAHLRALSTTLTEPGHTECLLCYVERMLREFGCDTTLRYARRFRDLRAPRATALERRLARKGGFCDCEIFWNGYEPAGHLLVYSWQDCPLCDPGRQVWCSEHEESAYEPDWPASLPPCTSVATRTTQPCANWRPRRRSRW